MSASLLVCSFFLFLISMEHSVFDLTPSLALATPPLIAAEEIRKKILFQLAFLLARVYVPKGYEKMSRREKK